MVFKKIIDKANYFKKNYPFGGAPKLTDTKYCLHCGENFMVGDYKVIVKNGHELIVCPNAPECDGDVMDWVDARGNHK